MDTEDNRIATVDAVSGSTIRCTLFLHARWTAIRGKLVIVAAGADLLLGRIADVTLENEIHKDPTWAGYIMTYGPVPNWSGHVDIERADIEVIRVVDTTTRAFVPMRRNPSSGTPVLAVDSASFAAFANERQYVVTLGTIPNSDGLPATIINKSHGPVEKGGHGEARMCCIFAQSRAGKSVWATMLLAAKLAAHPHMGMLMPDTQGDLWDPNKHNRGDFRWNYAEVLRRAGVSLDIIDIADIRLSSPIILKGLLKDVFREHLSMAADKAATLAQRVVKAMYDGDVSLTTLTSDNILIEVETLIGGVYARNNRQEHIDDANDLANNPSRRRGFDADVATIRQFFDGREPLWQLIRDVLSNGRKAVIRMHGLPDKEQDLVMREVMDKLAYQAKRLFAGDRGTANAIVVIDEARRFVPQEAHRSVSQGDEGETLAQTILGNIQEMGKFGVGFWFIAQSPATVDKTVLRGSHMRWFGRGLGIGVDRQHMEDVLGKRGIEEYERLEAQGGFYWVGIGLDNNVGTEGTYMSVHPFGGDATEAFINANPRIFR